MSSILKVKLHFSSGEKQPVSQFAFLYVYLFYLANEIVWCKKRIKPTLHASNMMPAKQGHDVVT